MTVGPEPPGDLGQANGHRAVSDRRLAAEPEQETGADREAISRPSDSATPGLVAFRPRFEPTVDDRQSGGYDADGRQPGGYDADSRQSAGSDADGREAVRYNATARQVVGYETVGREAATSDADGRPSAAAEPAELASSAWRAGPPAHRVDAEPAGPGRPLHGASLTRLKRPGSPAPGNGWGNGSQDRPPQGSGRPQDGRGRVSSAAASDAVAWNASELPGQAAITDTAV
jgi:hypothetical protein